jgi:uncharacterized membrane protein
MRVIAGCFLVLSLGLHLLWGGGFLLSAKYHEFQARTEAGDLSEVAGDLADDDTLAKERAASDVRVDTATTTRLLVLGCIVLALGLAQGVGAVLVFPGRGRIVVLPIVGLSLASVAVVLVLSGFSWLGLIAGVALVVALVLTLLRPAVT